MIKNIITDVNFDNYIGFTDIPEDDMRAYVLIRHNSDGEYEKEEELKIEALSYIKKKGGEDINEWIGNMRRIILQFNETDFLAYCTYFKKTFIEIYGDEYGHKSWKRYLCDLISISDTYIAFFKDNQNIREKMYQELKSLFPYYPERGDLVGFRIDGLFGYGLNSRIDGNEDIELDNFGEVSRYAYRMKYKEKGFPIPKK